MQWNHAFRRVFLLVLFALTTLPAMADAFSVQVSSLLPAVVVDPDLDQIEAFTSGAPLVNESVFSFQPVIFFPGYEPPAPSPFPSSTPYIVGAFPFDLVDLVTITELSNTLQPVYKSQPELLQIQGQIEALPDGTREINILPLFYSPFGDDIYLSIVPANAVAPPYGTAILNVDAFITQFPTLPAPPTATTPEISSFWLVSSGLTTILTTGWMRRRRATA